MSTLNRQKATLVLGSRYSCIVSLFILDVPLVPSATTCPIWDDNRYFG